MPIETEIKLKVSPEVLNRLMSHTMLNSNQLEPWTEKKLDNTYFDTSDLALTQEKVALRVRKVGENYLQTLKSQGKSVAGLSQRNEWEWPIVSQQLALELLTDKIWPDTLQALDKSLLEPIFRTDFIRYSTLLNYRYKDADHQIEVALDQGQIAAQGREEDICEVELELKQGDARALFDLAIQLAQDLPVLPSEISKAERGYRLLLQKKAEAIVPVMPIAAQLNTSERIHLLETWLQRSQRYAEDFAQFNQGALFSAWLHSLGHMQQLLLPVNAQLAATLQIMSASWSQQNPNSVHSAFVIWLSKRQWGMFSLLCAQWMFVHSLEQAH